MNFAMIPATFVALSLPALAIPAHAQSVGFTDLAIPAPHHGRDLMAGIWYPSAEAVPAQEMDHPIFIVPEAPRGLAPKDSQAPVVVLSHGLGGHFLSLSWLAVALADRGAIVVGVNHPNSTVRDFDMLAGLDHGTRAQDVSVMLDHLFASDWGGRIDPARISVVGFSYGGWTALSLAGVRGNSPQSYAAYCAAAAGASSHCNDIARAGVDMNDLDATRWGASYRDARITSVVAIDPGLTFDLGPAQVAQLEGRVDLVTLGEGADRLAATDIGPDGSNFAALVPQAPHHVIAPASHFSMLPICRPQGAAILAEENDDPVCDDPAGSDRAEVHAQMVQIVVKAVELE